MDNHFPYDEKVGVIAGTRAEFKDFASKQIDKGSAATYFYVSDAQQLRGYQGQLVKIGTYYTRTDLEEINANFDLCTLDYDTKD